MGARGLVDEILTGTHRYAYSASDARRQVCAIREQVENIPILPGLFSYSQIPPRSVDGFAGEAEALGCEAVVLHEANHVVECPIGDRLRAWTYDKPHSRRKVIAKNGPEPAAWHSGFIKCHDILNTPCNQETSFAVKYDADGLIFSVVCKERKVDQLLPVPGIGADNYNGNALKARVFWNPYESVHLLIDAAHDHEDYCHFVLDPSGGRLSETRLDEDWNGQWEGSVDIGSDQWTATFCIPWKTLNVDPPFPKTLGFQLVRVQNSPREVSAWFCTTGRRVNPMDFGHLNLR